MEKKSGYKLFNISTGETIKTWGGDLGVLSSPPNMIEIPKEIGYDHVYCPEIGQIYSGYKFDYLFLDTTVDEITIKTKDIDIERDRRIDEGFEFADKQIQFDISSQSNVLGACQLAALAIQFGAQPGDVYWSDPNQPFYWITKDNTLLTLDAFQTIEMGRAGARHKSRMIFIARQLKEMNPIPLDYREDVYWNV